MPQIAEEFVAAVGLAPFERVEQRTADAPMPQVLDETVKAVRVVLHERVQQRTAGRFEHAPQSPAEVVEAVTLVPRERAQQGTAGEIGEVPETASQDWRLQRTVEQACVDRAEIDEIATSGMA